MTLCWPSLCIHSALISCCVFLGWLCCYWFDCLCVCAALSHLDIRSLWLDWSYRNQSMPSDFLRISRSLSSCSVSRFFCVPSCSPHPITHPYIYSVCDAHMLMHRYRTISLFPDCRTHIHTNLLTHTHSLSLFSFRFSSPVIISNSSAALLLALGFLFVSVALRDVLAAALIFMSTNPVLHSSLSSVASIVLLSVWCDGRLICS